MYMTIVDMVGDQEKCQHFVKASFNDGTTATTKSGSDEDCMQNVFGWVSDVTQLASLVIFQRDNYAVFFSFAIL